MSKNEQQFYGQSFKNTRKLKNNRDDADKESPEVPQQTRQLKHRFLETVARVILGLLKTWVRLLH